MSARLFAHTAYRLASFEARSAYALLHEARALLRPDADPSVEIARVCDVSLEQASSLLEALRAYSLVSREGLTLLVGTGRRTPRTVPAQPRRSGDASTLEALRARLTSYAGSRRALAAELGCSEGALRAFSEGRKSIGAELASALSSALAARTPACVPTSAYQPVRTNDAGTHAGTQQLGTQPLSPPSHSPLSQSPGENDEEIHNISLSSASGEVGGAGEGTHAYQLRVPSTRGVCGTRRDAKSAAREDAIPSEGSIARKVRDAIVADPDLRAIVRGPGDFAVRVCADGAYPEVDVLAEVLRAGEWASRNPGRWSDGRAALSSWLRRAAEHAALMPKVSGTNAAKPHSRAHMRGRAPMPTPEEFAADLENPKAF